jgi:Na+-driven multidrug efflux pump
LAGKSIQPLKFYEKVKNNFNQKFIYLLLGSVIILALIIIYPKQNQNRNQSNQSQPSVNRQN